MGPRRTPAAARPAGGAESTTGAWSRASSTCCALAGLPAEYGPCTTIYNRFNRWSRRGIWEDVFYALSGASGVVDATSVDSTHVKAHRSAAGAKGGTSKAIGRSRGGRATKIHASADGAGRPVAFALTPGQIHDLVGAEAADRGPRLRRPRAPGAVRRTRLRGRHSSKSDPQTPPRL